MKKLLSLVLVVGMLFTLTCSAAADANAGKDPWSGGFDLNPYDKDADPSNGIRLSDQPGWFRPRAQKIAKELPIQYIVVDPDLACCEACTDAGETDCGCHTEYTEDGPYQGDYWWGPEDVNYFEYLVYEPVAIYLCGVPGCWCFGMTIESLKDMKKQEAYDLFMAQETDPAPTDDDFDTFWAWLGLW